MYSQVVLRAVSVGVLAWLGLAALPAGAANWFVLETNGAAGAIEVDVGSLRWRGDKRELRMRISYDQPQFQADGVSYRSVLATLQMNCDSGYAFLQSASFHPDTKADQAAIRDERFASGLPAHHSQALITEKTWATLRRSACIQPRPTVP